MAIATQGRLRSGRTGWRTVVLLLAPALILYGVFVLLPIVQGAYYSLFKWNGLQPLTNFIGLNNYATAFHSSNFIRALGNNVLVVVLSLFIQIPFALALAIYLNRKFPGRTIFRLIFFLPYVISEVITAILFYLMLQPNGLVNSALRGVGLGVLANDWFGSLSLVMITLFVVISWKYFGFHMILLLAGLQGIPHEVNEAALIEGAGRPARGERGPPDGRRRPLAGVPPRPPAVARPADPRFDLPLDHRRVPAV